MLAWVAPGVLRRNEIKRRKPEKVLTRPLSMLPSLRDKKQDNASGELLYPGGSDEFAADMEGCTYQRIPDRTGIDKDGDISI